MMRWKTACWISFVALGCTGTDFIADPPMTMQLQPTLQVTPDMAAVEIGASLVFEAVYLDATGMAVGDVSIAWAVSDESIAAVDETGLVNGLREGQVSVTAQVGDTSSDPVIVVVVGDPEEVALVRISPSAFDLNLGDSRLLSASTSNSRGEVLEKSPLWRSSDEAVATVDDRGQVTAVAPGQALISAATDGITSNLVRVTVFGLGRMGAFEPNPESTYQCRGGAGLQESDAGGLEVVFDDDFLVTAGPRLAIYLSTTNMVGPTSLELGPIESFSGAQTYSVPAGTQIGDYDWVIVHCVPFNVTFGYARLQ